MRKFATGGVIIAIVALATILYFMQLDDGTSRGVSELTASRGLITERAEVELANLAESQEPAGGEENSSDAVREEAPAARPQSKVEGQIPWSTMSTIVSAHNAFSEADEATLRFRYLGWPVGSGRQLDFPFSDFCRGRIVTESTQSDIENIIEPYNEQLESMLLVASTFMQEAFADYYGNEKFSRRPTTDEEKPPRRPDSGSSYWKDAYVETGGWSCQLEFRSSDYPAFEGALQELIRLSAERKGAVEQYISFLPEEN